MEEVGPYWACEGRRSLGQVREVHADPEPKRGGAKVRRYSPASSHLSWADPAYALTGGFNC